jgi:hypothetical protein
VEKKPLENVWESAFDLNETPEKDTIYTIHKYIYLPQYLLKAGDNQSSKRGEGVYSKKML